MRKILLLLFLLTSSLQGYSQSIVVRDAATGNPVPYASIFLIMDGKTVGGISCSEAGIATLPPAAFNQIRVSCIGYRDRLILKNDLAGDVLLTQQDIRLGELVIGDTTFSINFYKGEEGAPMGLGRDSEQIVYFRNPTKKEAMLSTFSVNFYKTESESVARLLMYRVCDSILHNQPGENLLPRDILLKIEPGTEGLKEFDLSEYKLVLPAQGAYIGLEEVKRSGEIIRYKTVVSNDPVYLYWQKYLGLPWYNLNRLLVVLYHKEFSRRRDRKEFRVPAWGIKIATE